MVSELNSFLRFVEILQICVFFTVEICQKLGVTHRLGLNVHDGVHLGLREIMILEFSLAKVSSTRFFE